MTADRFEARVADWLEDGPEVAPSAVVDAALRHAGAHPRSRVRTLGLRARRLAPALAAAVVVVAVAGGSLGALSFFRAPATPFVPVHVTGSETCTNRVPGQRLSPQAGTEMDEMRGRIDACVENASDPRVRGELTRKMDAWLADPPPTTWFGTIELRNPSGSWTGALVATFRDYQRGSDARVSVVAIGAGSYRGLAYRATAVSAGDGSTTISGTIEAIGDDVAVGSTWCWTATQAGDTPHTVVTRDCLVTSTDERLAGTASETRTIDVAGDGTRRDTGTISIRTASGGAWSGSFAGSGDWWVPGEVTGSATGSGALAGRRLDFRLVSEDGMHAALLGSIAQTSPAP